jgi:hypothetical protein
MSVYIILWAILNRSLNGVGGPPPSAIFGVEGTQPGAVPGAAGVLPNAVYGIAAAVFVAALTVIFGGLVAHLGRLLLGRPQRDMAREALRELVPLFGLLTLVLIFGIWLPTWPINFPSLIGKSVAIIQNGAVP